MVLEFSSVGESAKSPEGTSIAILTALFEFICLMASPTNPEIERASPDPKTASITISSSSIALKSLLDLSSVIFCSEKYRLDVSMLNKINQL